MKTKAKRDKDEGARLSRAAAWAWYLHGGGSERGRIITVERLEERRRRNFLPSRFLAESQQQHQDLSVAEESEHNSIGWDCGSFLFDSYELVALSTQLERDLTRLPSSTASSLKSREFSVSVTNSRSSIVAKDWMIRNGGVAMVAPTSATTKSCEDSTNENEQVCEDGVDSSNSSMGCFAFFATGMLSRSTHQSLRLLPLVSI